MLKMFFIVQVIYRHFISSIVRLLGAKGSPIIHKPTKLLFAFTVFLKHREKAIKAVEQITSR